MYLYDFNTILTAPIKNRSEKEMIRELIEFTKDLKKSGLNPGFHVMDNEASTAIKNKMTSMEIN